jgi:hypothetical protein
MATNMNVSIRYSTHLPVLMEVVKRTLGDILEIGPGVFSTPYLHWMCEKHKRNLLSVENSRPWFDFCRKYYRTNYHKHLLVEKWDDAEISIKKEWDVALIDHSPAERRVVEITKLANLAKYIIVHDADPYQDSNYHLSTIYPLFKYKFYFGEVEPATVVLSNFIDLKDFEVCL